MYTQLMEDYLLLSSQGAAKASKGVRKWLVTSMDAHQWKKRALALDHYGNQATAVFAQPRERGGPGKCDCDISRQ